MSFLLQIEEDGQMKIGKLLITMALLVGCGAPESATEDDQIVAAPRAGRRR